MKLLELLVQELPKRDGWPEGYEVVSTNGYGAVWAYKTKGCTAGRELYFHSTTEGHVTREQYEAAVQPQWNGQGMPPVGCECELSTGVEFYTHSGSFDFEEGTVVIVGGKVNFGLGDFVAVKVKGSNCITEINPTFLRPIRSEADKKRDEAVLQMLIDVKDITTEQAEELYNAGYRKQ